MSGAIGFVIAAIIAGPPGPAGVIPHPDWVRIPTGDEFVRVYPYAALRRGITGWAKMRCKVTAKGALTDCATVEEVPEGLGFGDAALRLAPKFEMRSKTRDGQSVEGASVEIPIRFQMAR